MSGPALPQHAFGPRQAMPLDNYLANIGTIARGLFPEATEEEKKRAQELRAAETAVANAAARLYNGVAEPGDFRALLEHLCDITVRDVTFVALPGVDPMQAYALGAKREGRAEIVFTIMKLIAAGRQEKPPHREGV